MKKISILLCLVLIFGICFFSGCTHEMVSLYIYKMPNKLVYNIGEKLDTTGLELKNIKTDSALSSIYNSNANFSGFDSTTSGKKEVTISYGKFTTSFNVYVANKVVESNKDLLTTINNASDDDIILIKKGEYTLDSPLEINNNKLTIGGEGKDKTKINGYVIIGGYLNEGEITYSNLAKDISLIGLSFMTKSKTTNSVISFEENKYKGIFGGINADKISGLNVIGCSFSGFRTGIKIKDADNCLFTGNCFTKLYVGGIEVTNSIKNSTISKNIITYIGKSVVYLNNEKKQDNIFGIKLAFNEETNVGVSLYKNSISKIAIKDLNLIYFNEKTKGNYSNLNYMNNSSAIIIHSSGKNNLQTSGLSIFFNSIGSCLNNILYSTNENDVINSSSVNYMSL
mgnify:FL=1